MLWFVEKEIISFRFASNESNKMYEKIMGKYESIPEPDPMSKFSKVMIWASPKPQPPTPTCDKLLGVTERFAIV